MEVEQGEAVLVKGSNGAGKTTLLRVLAGLVRLSSGSGQVQGVDLTQKGLQDLHRQVGILGDRTMLYEDLTVLENLVFWKELWGNPNLTEDPESVLAYLELPKDLWKLAVRKLSTGQKKRAVLALQVLKRPSIWLLDEPHAGLDKRGRALLDEIIKNVCAAGASVVLVSHQSQKGLVNRELELAGGRFI